MVDEKKANDIVEQKVDEHTRRLYGVPLHIDKTGKQIPFQSFAATFDNKLLEASIDVKDLVGRILGIEAKCNLLESRVTGVKEKKRVYSQPLCVECDRTVDYTALRKLGSEAPVETGLSRVLYSLSSGDGSSSYVLTVEASDPDSITVVQARLGMLARLSWMSWM